MTRYPRQVDREYLSCRSGGLNKIQMIDSGTLDLHQISSGAIVGGGTSLATNCPPDSNNLTAFMRALLDSLEWAPGARAPQHSEHAVRGSTIASLVSAPIWSRVAACRGVPSR